ncbi:MAG: AraC family transcriptional regulator [Saprospirales bacterium]|nr:AraC family transcriptional regulator [Saprospirales bacterium]
MKTPAPQHEDELLPSDAYSLEWLIQLHEIVERRLGEFDLKAEDIAHDLNMSRTQFFRQIKKDIGVTPSEYLEKARFEHGLHLLESGKASSVKAAAYGAGFRQVKYFSKLFKQRFGKLPSDCLVK